MASIQTRHVGFALVGIATLLTATIHAPVIAEQPAAAPPGLPHLAVLPLDTLARQIQAAVQRVQPRREERRFDEIGWVTTILDAERLAGQHGRPVFLFTHDGRMATGRC